VARPPDPLGDQVAIATVAGASSKKYKLAKTKGNVSYQTVSDQPEAEIGQPIAVPISFHGGMAYSNYNEQVAGCLVNTGVLVNEPTVIRAPSATGDVTLTNANQPCQYYFEVDVDTGADDGEPRLYCISHDTTDSELNVYKIDLDSTNFGVLVKTHTVGSISTTVLGRPAYWNMDGTNSYWHVPFGGQEIRALTAIESGTSADTWTLAGGTNAPGRLLQIFKNKLARTNSVAGEHNKIMLLDKATDPTTNTNWGGDHRVGGGGINITELGEASSQLIIGAEDGLYEFDGKGTPHNILPDIQYGADNCRGMVYWHGGWMIPAATGLWWTRTGQPVGPDTNPHNYANDISLGVAEYVKHGRWMGLATYGAYIYGLYVDSLGNKGLLHMGRERGETDPPGAGPIIWQVIDSVTADLDDFHGIFITKKSEYGASDVRPCLWYPHGNNLRYMWLDKDGAPRNRRGDIALGTSAGVVSGRIDGGLPGVNKQLP
jgi:hypothetical protein